MPRANAPPHSIKSCDAASSTEHVWLPKQVFEMVGLARYADRTPLRWLPTKHNANCKSLAAVSLD